MRGVVPLDYAISFYIGALAVISLVSAYMMPDYTGKEISVEYDAAIL